MLKDYRKRNISQVKKAVKQIQDKRVKSKESLDRRLLDFLRYRALFGKKRSDDDISDDAIKQWKEEGRDCSKWKLNETL